MTMTYATGGIVRSGEIKYELPNPGGCDLVIPWPLIKRLKLLVVELDRLNEDVLD